MYFTKQNIIATGLFFASALLLFTPTTALSQQNTTLDYLQAQIASLKAQIADLQQSQSFNFSQQITKTLAYGDIDPEVAFLQKKLNADSEISVSISGPGSPGNETQYFGQLTLEAVKSFQKKHAQDILSPLGLSSPTGIVGNSTRSVLNSISSSAPQESFSNPVGSSGQAGPDGSYQPFSLADLGKKDGFYIRNHVTSINNIEDTGSLEVFPGDSMSISGSGFSEDTRVVLGGFVLGSGLVEFHSESLVEAQIPSSFPSGVHDLDLVDGQHISSPSGKVIIRQTGSERPFIEEIEQTDQDIMISASNLGDSNIVHTNYKRFHSLAPSGGLLILPKDKVVASLGGRDFSGERLIYFYIINKNGISQQVEKTVQF